MSSTESLAPRSTKSMVDVIIPPQEEHLHQARVLIGEANVRINDLTTALSRDPSIVLELLKLANSMQYSGGRPPALTLKAVIERLGASVIIGTLDSLKTVEQLDQARGAKYLDAAKERCFLCSQVAKVLSEACAKNLVEECEVAALFLHIGEILAVVNFQAHYVKLAQEMPRVKLLYRLEKDFKFEPQKMGLLYLRKAGVPEALLFGIDPEAQSKTPGRTVMKPICAAASEMVLQFQADKWDKLAPGSQIPPKSPLRLLGLSDAQYAGVFEKATAVLVPPLAQK